MNIRIDWFGFLKVKFDQKVEELTMTDGSTIRDLFGYLSKKYQENFFTYVYDSEGDKLRKTIGVNINERPILQMKGLDTKLTDGDLVEFLPFFAGGG